MTTPDAPAYEVGDFLSYTLVTDTVVLEVVGVSASGNSITVRETADGEVLERDTSSGSPYPVVYIEAVPAPEVKPRTLRRRKNGRFGVPMGSRPAFVSPAPTRDGRPVRRVDYRF